MRLHQDFIICLVWITRIEQDVFIGQAKTKRFNNTLIRLNQPICKMSHSCLERLCELVFLKSGDWKTGGIPGKNLPMKGRTHSRNGWHPCDMFPFSMVLNSPLPPLRSVYLVLKRSHSTVVNTATEKKTKKTKEKTPLLPVLSHIWVAFIGGGRSSLCLSEMNSV